MATLKTIPKLDSFTTTFARAGVRDRGTRYPDTNEQRPSPLVEATLTVPLMPCTMRRPPVHMTTVLKVN